MKFKLNKFINIILSMQFIRYLYIGLINTFFGISIILILQNIININPYSSNLISFLACSFLSYSLHRRITFKAKRNKKQFGYYFSFIIICWILNIYTLRILLENNYNKNFAQIASISIYVLTNYSLNKFITFKNKV